MKGTCPRIAPATTSASTGDTVEAANDFARFPECTQEIIRAHSLWAAFEPELVGWLLARQPESVLQSVAVLQQAGWLDAEMRWTEPAYTWRRLTLPIDRRMLGRATERLEQLHVQRRCSEDASNKAWHKERDRWASWSNAFEVQQWIHLFQYNLSPGDAVGSCHIYACLTEARKAQGRGWIEEARTRLSQAEACAIRPGALFPLAYARTWQAYIELRCSSSMVDRMKSQATTDTDSLLALYLEGLAMFASDRLRANASIRQGIQLSKSTRNPLFEMYFHNLAAVLNLGVSIQVSQRHLSIAAMLGVTSPRPNQERALIQAIASLRQGQHAEAIQAAQTGLSFQSTTTVSSGRLEAILSVCFQLTGDHMRAKSFLQRAERSLSGSDCLDYLVWMRSIHLGEPLNMDLLLQQPKILVARNGEAFRRGDHVDLRQQPILATILRAVCTGPVSAEQVIEIAWPSDKASYSSLKNRLHTAIRTLRQKGLNEHLVFSGGEYFLVNALVVECL